MNIPSFTAETSLYKTAGNYRQRKISGVLRTGCKCRRSLESGSDQIGGPLSNHFRANSSAREFLKMESVSKDAELNARLWMTEVVTIRIAGPVAGIWATPSSFACGSVCWNECRIRGRRGNGMGARRGWRVLIPYESCTRNDQRLYLASRKEAEQLSMGAGDVSMGGSSVPGPTRLTGKHARAAENVWRRLPAS